MSNEAMNWAWDSGTPPGPRFVLVTLADQGQDHSGEDWSCFPSIHKLVKKTGFGRATVQRHLTWLWREGWITRARRRRKDGTLGINDFILHREAADRARLKIARQNAVEPLDGVEENPVDPVAGPCPDLRHGEGAPTMSQNEADHVSNCAQPCPNLSPQEPLEEPLEEPSQDGRAREPGDRGFEAGFAAYPDSGRARTDEPAARAAWALACHEVRADALIAAVRRYASEDQGLRKGDFGAPAFERWLSGKRWKVWLIDQATPAAPAAPIVQAFEGPPEIHHAFAAIADAGKVASYLIPCRFEPGPPARLIARTETAAAWLSRQRNVLSKFGLVVDCAQAASRQASGSVKGTGT